MKQTTDADVVAVARMLIAETGARGDGAELEGIAQVAHNRAARDGTSPSIVVGPPGSSTRGVWNNSDQFAADFAGAHRRGLAWVRAQEISRRVADGIAPNRIGTRLHFVHAQNFRRCAGTGECDSGRESQRGRKPWQCVQTGAGKRCVPSWAAVDPVNVGRATFSVPS